MAALSSGVKAPAIALPLLGGGKFELKDALERGPVLLAFFKISCPVCQFAFPYFERLYRAYGNGPATIVGVSQDDAANTQRFAREFGITFPIALDDTRSYPVSNAYGLTNVPTLFFIRPSGEIEISAVGWSRPEYEQIGRELATATEITQSPLIARHESVPDFKPG
jgi:peroxiredoxin